MKPPGFVSRAINLREAAAVIFALIALLPLLLFVAFLSVSSLISRPEAQGRYPIVVVISGFTGNSEHNKDVVRRFAQAGFYAIAPELYFREGGMQGKSFPEMGQISGKVTRAQYLGDIRAAADYAKQ